MFGAFFLGAALYPAIELAWRGRTAPCMSLAGGLSCMLLKRLHDKRKNRPLAHSALLGGLMITAIEYAFGKAFNRRYRVWDYRRVPLNLEGQICLPYTLIWCFLSAAALYAMRLCSSRRSSP